MPWASHDIWRDGRFREVISAAVRRLVIPFRFDCGATIWKCCGCIIVAQSSIGRERFAKNRAQAAAICDERFCRMWEFYLAAVELEFLHGSHMVFQLLLSTKRDAVPITRDFMIDAERTALAKIAKREH